MGNPKHRGVDNIMEKRKVGRPPLSQEERERRASRMPPKKTSGLGARKRVNRRKWTSLQGTRKTEEDYEDLAKIRGLKWTGDVLPHNTLAKTKWQCHAGHDFTARWADIYWGRGCGRCSGRGVRHERDYRRLATDLGIQFIGPVPETTRRLTKWLGPDGEEFDSTYQRLRQIRMRSGTYTYGK